MPYTLTFCLTTILLAGLALYFSRRRIFAKMMGLPPAKYQTGVERNQQTPMPDGRMLLADRYFPKSVQPYLKEKTQPSRRSTCQTGLCFKYDMFKRFWLLSQLFFDSIQALS